MNKNLLQKVLLGIIIIVLLMSVVLIELNTINYKKSLENYVLSNQKRIYEMLDENEKILNEAIRTNKLFKKEIAAIGSNYFQIFLILNDSYMNLKPIVKELKANEFITRDFSRYISKIILKNPMDNYDLKSDELNGIIYFNDIEQKKIAIMLEITTEYKKLFSIINDYKEFNELTNIYILLEKYKQKVEWDYNMFIN